MAGKEKTLLFSKYLVPENTRLALLERMFPELGRKKQINLITETLKEDWDSLEEGEADTLLEVLKRGFDSEIAFRKHLMELFNSLPKEVESDDLINLGLSILDNILYGWSSQSLPDSKDIDANKCFRFVCDTFQSVRYTGGKLNKGILNLFHKHLSSGSWKADELNPWIDSYTPEHILFTLIKARTRIGGSWKGRVEVSFLDPFDLLNRSEEATSLAVEYMKKVRQTDELTRRLMERIRPCDERGDYNPDAVFSAGRVTYQLASEKFAWIRIEFSPSECQKGDKYPGIVKKVQDVRASLMSRVKNPPTIIIEAEGPDGFSYKE